MSLKRDKWDAVFSQLVRERTNWTCDYCGRFFHHEKQKLHCSHFKSRRHKSTRYHPYNAFAHCVGCHRKLEEDPHEFTMHANIIYGEMTIDRVARLASIPVRLKPWQMDDIYQHMKTELERLQELRAGGVTCRLGFTLPEWYQDGITYRMGEAT
ncbi:hypothetical protein SAMN05216516_12115 [Izhakiella capsodis]|uniref:Matrin-type domain-containing protein n=1 Tax=Izhakiella capsodis TaxID=1367852 RepID=A0A1I5BTG2_9GAMM|nr:hypothetical protein [Izhakiella capsodis]SFN77928.1 hypothetical protein SAMN05216516_12115 [Izhakiella capsodis]